MNGLADQQRQPQQPKINNQRDQQPDQNLFVPCQHLVTRRSSRGTGPSWRKACRPTLAGRRGERFGLKAGRGPRTPEEAASQPLFSGSRTRLAPRHLPVKGTQNIFGKTTRKSFVLRPLTASLHRDAQGADYGGGRCRRPAHSGATQTRLTLTPENATGLKTTPSPKPNHPKKQSHHLRCRVVHLQKLTLTSTKFRGKENPKIVPQEPFTHRPLALAVIALILSGRPTQTNTNQ